MRACGQWLWLFIARAAAILIGLILVAVALPFRVPAASTFDGRPIVNLPRWAWLWGNDFDGLLGDRAGRWLNLTPFGLPATHWLSMYVWAALRNPANNMRFLSAFSAPVKDATTGFIGQQIVEDNAKHAGWHLSWAEQDGRRWYGFYLVRLWSETRALVIRLGFKIRPERAGHDEPRRGLTFKINPVKSL